MTADRQRAHPPHKAAGQGALSAGAGVGAGVGAAGAGSAISAGLASALAPFAVLSAAQPLMQAAQAGESSLNRALHTSSPRSGQVESDGPPTQEHPSMPLLRELAHRISKDGTLRSTLQLAAAQGNLHKLTGNQRLMDVVGQAVRMLPAGNVWGRGTDKLGKEYFIELEGIRLNGPKGIVSNPNLAKIEGTVYVQFDGDIQMGKNLEDMNSKMNEIASQIRDSINTTLSSNSYNGLIIKSEIEVIPVPPGMLPPLGSHVFTYGNGASDPSPEELKNLRISWAEKRGKLGYLYDVSHSGHEFLHFLGLSDRYTETIYLFGSGKTGSPTAPTAKWGRRENRILPLANVQPLLEKPDIDPYYPLDNAMSNRSVHLTQYQLSIVFSNHKREPEYHREVVVVGPLVEFNGQMELAKEEAVEFFKGKVYWWNVDENRRKFPSEYTHRPKTIIQTPFGFAGQNFSDVQSFFTDNDGTIDWDRFGPRILNNRREVRAAISANR